jgi:hypothetical protein
MVPMCPGKSSNFRGECILQRPHAWDQGDSKKRRCSEVRMSRLKVARLRNQIVGVNLIALA